MTQEDLQQIQKLIVDAVAHLATKDDVKEEVQSIEERLTQKIDSVEERLNKKIDSVEERLNKKIEASERKLSKQIKELELLTTDKLDGNIQTTTRRVDRVEVRVESIERHLNLAS